MNKIVNKLISAFKTTRNYIQRLLTIYKKTKKEYKNLKKQEIHDIIIKTN